MNEVILLTQDACPECDRLKLMLKGPLKGRYDGRIQILNRQDQPEAWARVAEASGVQKTPALIAGERVLLRTESLHEVRTFLEGAE